MAGLHHHVHRRQSGAVLPEALPHHSLDAVALGGAGHGLLRHRDAEPCPLESVAARRHHEAGIAAAQAVAEHLVELRGLAQSRRRREGSGTHAPLRLRREALAALGAPRVHHLTAALGGHAGPETVGLLTATLLGLIRSFHGTRIRMERATLSLEALVAPGKRAAIRRVQRAAVNWRNFHRTVGALCA